MIRGKILILGTACLTGLQSGMIYSWSRGIFALMTDEKAQISLSSQDQVFVLNSMVIFKLVGAILSGYLMEMCGRRPTLIVLSVSNLIGCVPGFIGSTVVSLCLTQALHGLFLNVFVAVMPIVVAETVESNIRGAVNTLSAVAMQVGMIATSILSATNYYIYIGIPVIPAVAVMALVLMLKETPYFSLMKHGKDKARERFIWLRGYCDEEDLTRMEESIKLRSARSWRLQGFKELLKKSTRKSLGIVVLFAFLAKISGFDTINALLPTIVPKSWISSSTAVLITSITSFCASLISTFLVDRVGRRTLNIISYLGSSVAFLFVTVWYYFNEQTSFDTESTLWFPLAMFVLVGIFSNLGSQLLYHILMGELFSPDLSGRASMVVTIVTAATLALYNQAFYPVKKAVGMSGTMLVCTTFNIIGCICVYTLLMETKGKNLEEIQEEISRADAKSQPL